MAAPSDVRVRMPDPLVELPGDDGPFFINPMWVELVEPAEDSGALVWLRCGEARITTLSAEAAAHTLGVVLTDPRPTG